MLAKAPVEIELELVPVDGKDYMSGSLAIKDWNAGVEFTVTSGRLRSGEAYDIGLKRIMRSQALELGVVVVKLRFNRDNDYRSFRYVRKPSEDWV